MEHIPDDQLPKHIILGEYTYVFKDKKVNYNYAYRWRNRKCGVIININEDNLRKIINKSIGVKIEYQKVSKKNHTCNLNNQQINSNEVLITKDSIILGTDLIKKNLDKSLEWHILNLKNNNIILTRNQIKNILQKFRDINFPKDYIFLNDLINIKINFSEINPNLQNLNYCYGKQIIINTKKK